VPLPALVRRDGPVAFAFVLLAAWTTWWHRHYGMIDFGGLDGGLLVQAAWGVSTGNIPYHDIPDPLPPLFFLGAGWAFRLLGPSWSSLNWLVTAYAFVTLTWSFLLLGRITRRPWYALAVAFALQAITLMPLSWWWYNQITTLAGVLALLSGYGLSRAPGDRGLAVSLGASVALLLLTKLNTAVFLSAAIALFLLARRETRKTTLACFACAGLADLLLLTLQHVPVLDYLHLVSQFSSRVSSLDWIRFCLIGAQPVEHWTGLIMFAFFTLGGVALSLLDRDKVRRQGAIIWILIAAGATSIQMVTNNDFKLGDIALVVARAAGLDDRPGPFPHRQHRPPLLRRERGARPRPEKPSLFPRAFHRILLRSGTPGSRYGARFREGVRDGRRKDLLRPTPRFLLCRLRLALSNRPAHLVGKSTLFPLGRKRSDRHPDALVLERTLPLAARKRAV
jgi:hypothetical protein